MKKDEKEYYLKIINLQESMISGLSSHNYSKMVVAQKELEHMQRSEFNTIVKETKQKKDDMFKRFKNLLTELESVVKELNGI